jgi:hypothetical protein
MSNTRKLRPLDGFSNATDGDVASRGTSIVTNLTGNPKFPNPPVDLTLLKTAIERLLALMAEALDGGPKVVAEKNEQRETIIKMLRLLGRYVEVTADNDMAAFTTSGFQLASTTKTTVPALSERIRKIERGAVSGQIIVSLMVDPKAYSYELRYGIAVPAGATIAWTTLPLTNVRPPVVLNSLVPATTYVFQTRGVTKDGYTDWSEPVTFICT